MHKKRLIDIVGAGGAVVEPFDADSDVPIARFSDPSGNVWTIYQHGG
jgi:predicted enzyme related to lactoylglutathione lyase